MKLNLGCGHDVLPGWVNVDNGLDLPAGVVRGDLSVTPWPWPDNSAEQIRALDVLEHLPNTVAFMDEAWRVLAPAGELVVRVPAFDNENAWRDPTHVRAFHPTTFQYFDPYTEWGARYGMYTARKWHLLETEAGGNITVKMSPIK